MDINPNIIGKKVEAEWVSISGAAVILSISRDTVYKLIHARRLEAKKLGAKSIVSVASIRRLTESLPDVRAGLPKPQKLPPRRRGRPRKVLLPPITTAAE
jgi:excisionase family DNA binding protein